LAVTTKRYVFTAIIIDCNFMQIIGRKKEIESLTHLTETKQSEFVAISGRRRVGKNLFGTFWYANIWETGLLFIIQEWRIPKWRYN
jgi:uncharacterized protein Veg